MVQAMKRAVVIAGLLVAFPLAAHAQGAANIMDNIITSYIQVANQASGKILPLVLGTYTILSVITLFFALAQEGASSGLERMFPTIVRAILVWGFGLYMLDNAPAFSKLVLQTMNYVAGQIGGQQITPSKILLQGLAIAKIAAQAADAVGIAHLGTAIALDICAIIVAGCFAVIVTQLVVMTVEWYLCAAILMILLPFIGTPWTSDIGWNYYRTVLSLSIGVLVTAFLSVVAYSFTHAWVIEVAGGDGIVTLDAMILMFCQALVLAYLVMRCPQTCMRAVGSPATTSGAGFMASTSYMARSGAAAVAGAGSAAGRAVSAAGAVSNALQGPAGRMPSAGAPSFGGSVSRSLGSRFSGGASP